MSINIISFFELLIFLHVALMRGLEDIRRQQFSTLVANSSFDRLISLVFLGSYLLIVVDVNLLSVSDTMFSTRYMGCMLVPNLLSMSC